MTPRRISALALFLLAGCSSPTEIITLPTSMGRGPAPYDPDGVYAPRVTPGEIATTIDNGLFPAPVGARWVYESRGGREVERTEVVVESQTRAIWGTEALTIRDTVFLDGVMRESTRGWFGQDAAGNVWLLGEDAGEYSPAGEIVYGEVWESGVEGALPGVMMLASPAPGDVYRLEYFAGQIEGVGIVDAVGEEITVPAGTFTGCVRIRERSAVEQVDEYKHFCPGVGLVLEEETPLRIELVELSGL